MEGADEVHLYFIGHTCPVNARALPYVNKIANTANGKKVKFVGITDADAAGHKAWQSKFDAKYPVLLDTDKKVITSYGAQRSPWFIVVDKKGNISHTDKGYSQASLKMMNEHIAKVNGTKPVDVDLSGAPKNMTYG
jgi:peroxiredoxin